MTSEQLLKELKLSPALANKRNGKVVYHLEDSNEFSKIFNRLDASEKVNQNFAKSALSNNRSTIIFEGDNIEAQLLGDFSSNEYDLVIEGGK